MARAARVDNTYDRGVIKGLEMAREALSEIAGDPGRQTLGKARSAVELVIATERAERGFQPEALELLEQIRALRAKVPAGDREPEQQEQDESDEEPEPEPEPEPAPPPRAARTRAEPAKPPPAKRAPTPPPAELAGAFAKPATKPPPPPADDADDEWASDT